MSQKGNNEGTFGGDRASESVADLKEGTHIGRYQILGLLGKGGMGAVYKAYDPELDRSIAIKMLNIAPDQGETASKPHARLMREAQALAKLSHPNVVSIFDVGHYEKSVYIAMEYLQGRTLREWIDQTKPSQKQIIEAFIHAGHGLAAAHSEGIVHRDFKPENVLVGDKGQVKVLDFGLARAAGKEESAFPNKQPEAPHEFSSGEKFLSTPLTQVGATVGTTVYMAPEHFLGQTLDEQTDQFSFCVSLFEAVYGERPFTGANLLELKENLTTGRTVTPAATDVPKWIEDIIQKGLSVSKDKRYPSMVGLLDALGDDPELVALQKRKRRLLMVAFVFAALFFTFIGTNLWGLSDELCTGADKNLTDVWNAQTKHQMRTAFTNTKLSYADDSYVRVEKRFDDYLARWKKEYTETCQATRLRGEQSEEIMDLKMGCLNRHLQAANALVHVLSQADNTVVGKAIQAVSSLPGFSSCQDTQALQSRIPLPKDEQTKNKVAAIRKKLAHVEAFHNTGKYEAGLALAKGLEQEAIEVDYGPLQAEVQLELAHLFDRIGDYKNAEKALVDSARVAGKHADGLLAAKALTLLVWVVGYSQARYEVGLSIARDAEIMIDVAKGDDTLRSKLFNNMGVVHGSQGNNEKALEHFLQTLAIQQRNLGPDHHKLATTLNNLGVTQLNKGDYKKSIDYYRKSLTIWQAALGPEHPETVHPLNNLGVVFMHQGMYAKALVYYQKSLTIRQKSLGPAHPLVAVTLDNLGEVHLEKKDHDKALDYYRQALTIRKNALGSKHPLVAQSLNGLGTALLQKQMPEKAREPLERAVAICEHKTCDLYLRGNGLFGLAHALVLSAQDTKRAIKLAKQARDVFQKTPKEFKDVIHQVDVWLQKHGKGDSLAQQ